MPANGGSAVNPRPGDFRGASVFAEGNYVILHCHQTWPDDKDYAGIDIFGFTDDGKIIEHWGVLQIIPETAKNPNWHVLIPS